MAERTELRNRIIELENVLEEIRKGKVDALTNDSTGKDRLFTEQSADYSYRVMIENMDDGALIAGIRKCTILYHNQYMSRLLDFENANITGKKLSEFISDDSKTLFDQALTRVTDEYRNVELDLVSVIGTLVPVNLRFSNAVLDTKDVFIFLVSDLRQDREQKKCWTQRSYGGIYSKRRPTHF